MNHLTKTGYLFLTILTALLFSCSKEVINPDPGTPTVALNTETGEYKVKSGKSVTLEATVQNALKPIYSWKLDGKIISTDLNCLFSGEIVGEYFITFRIDAENGSVEKQVKVSVMEKLPPEIDMSSSLLAIVGKETEIKATVKYADNATYLWRLEGAIVSETETYVHNQSSLGAQTLTLRVTTEDGQDMKVFTINTLPAPLPELFFDNGHYRVASNIDELRKMTVPLGKSLVLAPVICNISNPSTFVWTVDGVVQNESSEFLTFEPTAKGVYLVTVTEQSSQAKATVQVTCTEPEGSFFRPKTVGSKATAAKAFDYIPAPGQFINYQIGTTKAKALQDLQTSLNGGTASYIGAYGGYWIVGFDHSVEDVTNKADLKISGNAFAGWSEPGIVWVMQDENGNGLPDDTWYELKGSETGKPETKQRYAITYYKPKTSGADVLWTDNLGRANTVDYNGYHTQAYYYPMFITEDYYTLVGTCLASGVFTSGGIVYAKDFPWGYVDNYNTDPSRKMDEFWLEDAIKADGSPANLKYIDFVKVHTGMAGKGAAVGEISTEPGCPTNLNF